MESLPEGFDCERGPRGTLAISRKLAPLLRAAGYGLDSDGDTRPSGLSGRKPLLELATPGGVFLVRKLTHGGLLRFVSRDRFGDSSRPFRELEVSERLARAGVATPEIAAARARPAPVFGWRLDVVTRRIEGAVDLDEILARARDRRLDRRTVSRVAASFGRLVREVHAAGCVHADLTTKNVLVLESTLGSDRPETAILDLDRAEIVPALRPEDRRANLARLHRYVARAERTLGQSLRRTDWARFLGAYEPDRAARKSHARAVLAIEARFRLVHALGGGLERLFGGRGNARAAPPRSRILG